MKKLTKAFLLRLKVPIDVLFAAFTVPSALLFLAVRRVGVRNLRLTRKVLLKIGVFPIRDHYYEPLFNPDHLHHKLSEDRSLPGLDLNELGQLNFVRSLACADELRDLNLSERRSDTNDFSFQNSSFGSGDAEFLYQLIRHILPKRMIEIGSGNSTKIACLALEKNQELFDADCEHICIEPYEMPWLEDLGPEIMRQRVEDCPLSLFETLESGDLLFIDSSHMIRPQGDVLFEYLTILPVLKSGVFVHIHDIFTPKDYPKTWIVEENRFWNEQYLLEALLTGTSKFKVVAALNFLTHHHFQELKSVCPYLTEDREPGSFYIQVR